MVTIKDVAREAGVSPATVSRVINGTAKVDINKKNKVFETIKQLEFKPNEVARSLIKKSSKSIGLIIPSIINPYFNQIAEDVEKTANKHNYKTILCNSNGDFNKEKAYIESLQLSNIDGFLIISENEELEKFLECVNVPVVALDRYFFKPENNALKYSIVKTDNYLGGQMAAQHLINCGCRRIAHIRGPENSVIATERVHGFQNVLNENHMDYLILASSYTFEDGLSASYRLLHEHPEIDGVFAGNDLIGISLIKAAYIENRKIPDQLQIVGYDNILFSELVTPSLTTIAQPINTMGETATELLLPQIVGSSIKNEKIILPIKLIERETTKKKTE
jgi:LacI family transcriptional regulator